MSRDVQQEFPRLCWSHVFAPGDAELRLGQSYLGHFGFRRLALAETVTALMQQQAPTGWQLRSAVVTFGAEAIHDVAAIETAHRPVFDGSVLTNLRLLQKGSPIVTGVGASEREWRVGSSLPNPAPDFGAPEDLPELENWPEDTERECRDASLLLDAGDELQTLGGFVKFRQPRELNPTEMLSLLEPWVVMPDPEGRWRTVHELVLEVHRRGPLTQSECEGYFRVMLARSEWIAGAERLVADIWSNRGEPIATIYISTQLTD